jgi:hypothetical protein
MPGTAATLARLDGMREAVSLAIIGSAALITLAAAGTAVVQDATQRTAKERGQLDASINRIVTEQVARRDEVFTNPATAAKPAPDVAAKPAPDVAKASSDIMQPPRTPEARKEAARHRDPEERAEREARAATAVRHTRKRPPQQNVAAFRPDRVLPDAFLSIRKLAFGVLR